MNVLGRYVKAIFGEDEPIQATYVSGTNSVSVGPDVIAKGINVVTQRGAATDHPATQPSDTQTVTN